MITVTLTGKYPPYHPDITVVEERCLFTHSERIWDCPGSRREFHPVKHEVVSFRAAKLTNWDLDISGSPGTYPEWRATPFWIPRLPYVFTADSVVSYLNSNEFDMGSDAWEDFTAAAFDSLTQQTPETVSLLNLVWDIATLKGLLKQAAKVCKKIWKCLKSIGAFNGLHFIQTLTLRRLLKNVADGFLISEFGFKPLIRELEALATRTVSIMKRLEFLRKTQGAVIGAKYARSHTFTKGDVELGLADDWGFKAATYHLTGIRGHVKYTCTAKVKNDLVGLDDLCAGIRMYLKSLGLGNVATFLWDLVPWSFVVDWFANVSGLLDRYASVDAFQGELKVLSAGTGFKKSVTADVVLRGSTVRGELPHGQLFFKQYIRQAGLDRALNLFSPIASLTPKQLEVLSALIAQRL